MEKNKKIFEALEETQLNWTANKLPLVHKKENGDLLKTKNFGVFRSDNEECLGIVGNQYNIIQNSELVETIIDLQDKFGGNVTGGELQNGRKVFCQLSLDDYTVANDTIKRYITALNSFDGSTSIGFGSTNQVVICSNSFHIAYKNLEKFRHTISANDRLHLAIKEYKNALVKDNSLMLNFEKMTDHKIQKPIFEKIVNKLFNVKLDVKVDQISTRKNNMLNEFNTIVASEVDSHGETLWGLFNAVTYWTNHVTSKNENDIMLGSGYQKNLTTYNEIMAWIDDNTAKSVLVTK